MTLEMSDFTKEQQTKQPSDERVIQGIIGRVQRESLPVDKLVKENNLYGVLKRKIYAFTGRNMETGNKEVVLISPQITINKWENFDKAQKMLKSLGKKAVHNAAILGDINHETAQHLIENPFEINVVAKVDFSGIKERAKSLGAELKKTSNQGKTILNPSATIFEKKISGKDFFKKGFSVVMVAGMALTSCKAIPITITETQTDSSGKPVNIPTNEGKPTQEETAVPTASRPNFEGGAGGPYTAKQIEKIQNGEFVIWENLYKEWLKYWGAAENRPFHPETKDLHYKYLFDEEDNAFVTLESPGEYPEKTFALPMKDGMFITTPPQTPKGKFTIPEGFGPLELTESVAYRNGAVAGLDDSKNFAERPDMETGQQVREIVINSESQSPEKFSSVTLEDFTSGKLQKIVSDWLEKNSPFSGREIFSDKIIIVRHSWGYEMLTINCNNGVLMEGYLSDRSTFPAKITSYFNMQFPKDFFPHPENPEKEGDFNDLEYFLVSQTWLNPNGSYTTLYYLFYKNPFESLPDNKSNKVPFPLYRVKNLEIKSFDMELLHLLDVKKFMNYSDSPKPYLEEWLNNGNLPKELENFIFPGLMQLLD